MSKKPEHDAVAAEPITLQLEPITRAQIESFARATRSEHYSDTPATYPTVFRWTEFRWLERLKLDLKGLLHTEQEYEYLQPLKQGDAPFVSTRLAEHRERRGMVFIDLESDVKVDGRTVVITRSSFVIRTEGGAA